MKYFFSTRNESKIFFFFTDCVENYFNLEAFVDNNHTIKLFSYYPLNIWIFAHKISFSSFKIHIKVYVPSWKFCLKYVYKLIISKEKINFMNSWFINELNE